MIKGGSETLHPTRTNKDNQRTDSADDSNSVIWLKFNSLRADKTDLV